MPDVLSARRLGRTRLLRQGLLERRTGDLEALVDELIGLLAQVPRDPYLALWSRFERFAPPDLESSLLDRRVVRMVAMRGTIHLLTADDAVGLRRLFQPVLDGEMARHSEHKDQLAGLDLGPVTTFAQDQLCEPHTVPQLRAALRERFPDADPAALALACRNTVPLVQVPPRGLWSRSGAVTYVTAEEWLGRPVEPAPSLPTVARRYLAAFGPATVADMATWTRLTGLRSVVEAMRPELRTWADDDGRELFDVEGAPIASGDEPAPARFLPEYDNALLAHADRGWVVPAGAESLYERRGLGIGHVLVDGLVQATWRLDKPRGGPAVVDVVHQPTLTKRSLTAMVTEAERARPILGQGADDVEVRLRPAGR